MRAHLKVGATRRLLHGFGSLLSQESRPRAGWADPPTEKVRMSVVSPAWRHPDEPRRRPDHLTCHSSRTVRNELSLFEDSIGVCMGRVMRARQRTGKLIESICRLTAQLSTRPPAG